MTDADQVKATTAAINDAVADHGRAFPAVIGSTRMAAAGSSTRPRSRRPGAAQPRVHGVFAPDADVTIGALDPTIGDRSPSEHPAIAIKAVTAAVTGYDAAGLVSTAKHFPGHGAVTVDSQEALPVRDVPLAELPATTSRRSRPPSRPVRLR